MQTAGYPARRLALARRPPRGFRAVVLGGITISDQTVAYNADTSQAAQDLLDSIFKIATELLHVERASLLVRDDAVNTDFIIAKARGLADDVVRQTRIREGEGIAGRVAASRQPLLVRSRDEAAAPSPGTYRSESFVSLPIVVNGRTIGVLNLSERADGGAFQESDLETLQLLADHIGTCLVRGRVEGQLRELAELAETDPLTRLYNRRYFDRQLRSELERARRSGEVVGLLLIDVNSFKQINDQLGHSVGDEVMKSVADVIRRSLRAYDVPVRFGGDEFAVLLPSADQATARRVGDRIVGSIAAALPHDVLVTVPGVGLSVGVATAPPADEAKDLVDRADTAMYRAKSEGGGVAVWEAEMSQNVGARRLRPPRLPAPYLMDPGRLANAELQRLVPPPLAEEWNVLVIGREGQVLTIVMPEPSNAAVEALSSATGHAIYPVYSAAADIERARRTLSS